LEAQNQKSHYEKKLIDEQAKVDALQQVANDLQGEFVVSDCSLSSDYEDAQCAVGLDGQG
jgi:hypothetical protein